MKHDIYMTSRADSSLNVIIDTKYKIRSAEARKKGNKGISQSDLYQMTSYAFRRGCKTVLLLYPNYSEELQPDDCFSITSAYAGQDRINVIASEVPFWDMSRFASIPEKLYKKLEALLTHIKNLQNTL
jgi:5-methylcytosine-specific restriction enzyme subunit McrC